jgi:hypothetical protein
MAVAEGLGALGREQAAKAGVAVRQRQHEQGGFVPYPGDDLGAAEVDLALAGCPRGPSSGGAARSSFSKGCSARRWLARSSSLATFRSSARVPAVTIAASTTPKVNHLGREFPLPRVCVLRRLPDPDHVELGDRLLLSDQAGHV